jgi:hypothetical protein
MRLRTERTNIENNEDNHKAETTPGMAVKNVES